MSATNKRDYSLNREKNHIADAHGTVYDNYVTIGSNMINKTQPISIEKRKYIKLAEQIQKIVANEQSNQHAN